MSLTPYDWNESVQTRSDWVETRLSKGSPVVGISYPEGILLLTLHRTRRKVFEVYDRLMLSALGQESDVEAIRLASIDFAHREGFTRSPEDVTAMRLVGSVLSPALKRAFGDPMTAPFIFKGLVAELGASPEQDLFLSLSFDGEFRTGTRHSVLGGTAAAEESMARMIADCSPTHLDEALKLAIRVWATGAAAAGDVVLGGLRRKDPDEEDAENAVGAAEWLERELKLGSLEAGVLHRNPRAESRFELVDQGRLSTAAQAAGADLAAG